jgi:hypothetical protein
MKTSRAPSLEFAKEAKSGWSRAGKLLPRRAGRLGVAADQTLSNWGRRPHRSRQARERRADGNQPAGRAGARRWSGTYY